GSADATLTASGDASKNTGALYNYNGCIGMLASGSFDGAIAVSFATTGKSNIVVKYDACTIRNNGGTSNRINELILQYRVGTTGNFTNCYGTEYRNNTTVQTGAVTTPQNQLTRSILLPSACDNQPYVQVRWISRDHSQLAGSRESLAIDNVVIDGATIAHFYLNPLNSTACDAVTSWGSNPDGSGTNPANFTTDYQVFHIQNSATATATAAWTVSGKGSKIIIGDGTTATKFTVPAAGAFTGLADISANSTFEINNASTLPTYGSVLGTFGTNCTIIYGNSGSLSVPDRDYTSNNLVFNNTGTKTWSPSGNRSLSGDLSVTNGATLSMGNGIVISVGGNVLVDATSTVGCASSSNRLSGTASKSFTMNGTLRVTSNETQTASATSPMQYQYNGYGTYALGSSSWVSFRNPTTSAITQGIDGFSGITFANIEMWNGTAVTVSWVLKNDITVTGNIVFPRTSTGATSFSLGAYNLKLAGKFALTGGPNSNTYLGGRTFNGATGTITLNGSSAQQTLGGGDLFGTLNNLTIDNAAGITLDSSIVVNGTLSLVNGSLALGVNPGTSTPNTLTYGASSTLKYASTTASQVTTDLEFPATNGPKNLTIANKNGVTLHAARTIAGVLNCSSGLLTTDNVKILTLSSTATSAVGTSSDTSYVNGPIERTLPASLASGNAYTFPVGKSAYTPFELVNPTTTSGGTVVIRAEVIDGDCGGSAGTNLSNLNTNRYWTASFTSGNGNFTNTKIKLTDAGLRPTTGIGQSSDVSGDYNSLGGTFTGSNVVSAMTTTTLGYFSTGDKTDMGRLYAGTYSVGSGNWPNLQAVVDTLSSEFLAGNVVFELNSSYTGTETAPLVLYPFADEGHNYTVTIRPASGVTGKTISGTSAVALFDFNGVDNMIIDGRAGGSGSSKDLTVANSGGPVVRYIKDATNNTLKYLTISASNGVASSGALLFSTGTTTGNDNNTVDNCDINCNGTYAKGVFSSGSSSTIDNGNNSITNCNIYDWYTTDANGGACAGVYLGNYNNAWTITNNNFYYKTARTAVIKNTYYGVYISTATGNNFTVNNNYVGGNGPAGGDGNFVLNGPYENKIWAIALSTVGTTTPSNIQGNTVSKFDLTTTPQSSGSTSSLFYGIYMSDGSANIGTTADNLIGSLTSNDAIKITMTNSPNTSYIDGIRLGNTSSNDVLNIGSQSNKNIIGGITVTHADTSSILYSDTTSNTYVDGMRLGVSPGYTNFSVQNNIIGGTVANSIRVLYMKGIMNGIYETSGMYGTTQIRNNTIQNLTHNGLGYTSVLRGIWAPTNNNTITGNTIHDLNYAGTNTKSGSDAGLYGILLNTTAQNQLVNTNTIYNVNSTNTTVLQYIYGIYYSGPTTGGTNSISGNKIYNLNTDNTNVSASYVRGIVLNAGINLTVANNMIALGDTIKANQLVAGIDKAGADASFYYNTISLTGTQASGSSNSYGWRRTSDNADIVKNNIIVNLRNNGGSSTGKHYAFRTFHLSTLTSDYNDFYVDPANTFGYIAQYYPIASGSTAVDCQTLASWQAASALDAHTSNAAVNFTSTNDLHLAGASIGSFSLQGAVVPVTTDFDGDTRSSVVPYMGCDEQTEKLYSQLDMKTVLQFYYDGATGMMSRDTVCAVLKTVDTYVTVDSAQAFIDSVTGAGTYIFKKANPSGSYYLTVRHRTSIETASANPVTFTNKALTYDFSDAQEEAYGNNLALVGDKYCIYGGDCDQSGGVDFSDMLLIDNDSFNYNTGYIITDVNGDGGADFNDMICVDNSSYVYVSSSLPLPPPSKRVKHVHVRPATNQQVKKADSQKSNNQ
ncbi:MAG: hypothetical protein LWX56_00325, partial [Ignavibacteria bacterium]|nr:hypothetical protein [Ignavibacteria bacterium]